MYKQIKKLPWLMMIPENGSASSSNDSFEAEVMTGLQECRFFFNNPGK
jgi:hypothetical protein